MGMPKPEPATAKLVSLLLDAKADIDGSKATIVHSRTHRTIHGVAAFFVNGLGFKAKALQMMSLQHGSKVAVPPVLAAAFWNRPALMRVLLEARANAASSYRGETLVEQARRL